ncbi:MAG: DUF3109 family protein [Candidatus Omnitrophica bacterium]|nr:DUF3109 family protein [Candidatus Omnitrophota bacterium]
MVLIGKVLVSSDVIENRFACDIKECKGLCCCEGGGGAPLEPEEISVFEEIFPGVAGYLRKTSVEKIKKDGYWVRNVWGGFETPLTDDGWCAYAVEKDGIIFCGIEIAWQQKKIEFRKPISCHLYPVRVKKIGIFEGLVFERWDICRTRSKEGTPFLYEFVSQALIRKYGEEFIRRLHQISLQASKNNKK